MPIEFQLALRAETFARIMTGNITTWNDPSIVADNPDYTLPPHNITVVYNPAPSSTNRIFCYALSQIDSTFATLVGNGTTYTCNWTAVWSRTANYLLAYHWTDSNYIVENTNYSIGYTTPEEASVLGTPYGDMINAAGERVSINSDTLLVAALEMGIYTNGTMYDFSHGTSRFAYPIASPINFVYNVQQARTTVCITA